MSWSTTTILMKLRVCQIWRSWTFSFIWIHFDVKTYFKIVLFNNLGFNGFFFQSAEVRHVYKTLFCVAWMLLTMSLRMTIWCVFFQSSHAGPSTTRAILYMFYFRLPQQGGRWPIAMHWIEAIGRSGSMMTTSVAVADGNITQAHQVCGGCKGTHTHTPMLVSFAFRGAPNSWNLHTDWMNHVTCMYMSWCFVGKM